MAASPLQNTSGNEYVFKRKTRFPKLREVIVKENGPHWYVATWEALPKMAGSPDIVPTQVLTIFKKR